MFKDYDCFYAAVFEREDPKLKSLPLAVQQKQIIVTCNYEARRRGLYKLQLVREARKKCPDVIILLGEDLTRFRNASKDNYNFLTTFTWSKKTERLGFDEVFIDVTDLVDYNIELLNRNALYRSFFHLDQNDPTAGFSYDASGVVGHTFPNISLSQEQSPCSASSPSSTDPNDLLLRLRVGSHLAQHLRHQLEEQKGYTCTVGISTNKLVSKLVGNVNKPKGQTTLIPPYDANNGGESNINRFIDGHDIGKVPGIGFKMAQKIRAHILGCPAEYDAGLVYGRTEEDIKVGDIRTFDAMGPETLRKILNGPGVPKDLADKVWGLLNGVDDSEVAKAKEVPRQISIEDSYIRLDELSEVKRELKMLACSLIKRMRLDLTSLLDDDYVDTSSDPDNGTKHDNDVNTSRRWIAHPRTLRLSTRPRPPVNADGTRSRTFARISKSGSMPSFVFSLTTTIDVSAEKLIAETLMPLFRKLHPERSGWNLSLVNLCATHMALTACDDKDGAGRDIGRMFRRQEDVLKEWRVEDIDVAPSDEDHDEELRVRELGLDESEIQRRRNDKIQDEQLGGSEDEIQHTQENLFGQDIWDSGNEDQGPGEACSICGAIMPPFAIIAHERFHALPD